MDRGAVADDFERVYLQAWVHKVAMVLVIVGALVWLVYGLTAGRFNVVDRLAGKGVLGRAIYIAVGLAALYVMFDRDLYLPFLGETVIPNGALPEKTPERWTEKATVAVPANTKVVFWAAEPAGAGAMGGLKGPAEAYGAYENAGVTISSAEGVAELRVRSPQSYKVPVRGTLAPHIHYRIYTSDGMLGRIKTVFLGDGRIEGFSDF
jgi:uncharacterized membrane protein YuzA (DUF378 family)